MRPVLEFEHPSAGQLLALSLPTWVFSGYDLARRNFLAAYLTYGLLLPIDTVGWLVMLSGVASIPVQLVTGAMCDRVVRGFGPRVTWMVLGTVLLTAGGIIVVAANWGPSSVLLTALGLVGLIAGWAVCNVTHGAWALEISSTPSQRARIFGLRSLAGIAGGVSFALIGAKAAHALPPFLAILATVSVIAPLAHLLLIAIVPDRAAARGERHKVSLIAPMRLLFADTENRRLALLFACNGMHTAVAGTSYLYCVREALRLPGWGETGFVVQTVCAGIGIATATRFASHWRPRQLLCLVTVINLILAVSLALMPPARPALLMAWTALFGLVSTLDFMVLRVLLGERLDATRTSSRAHPGAAAFYAGFHLPYNLGAALAAGLLLLSFRILNADPSAGVKTEQAFFVFQILPALISAVLMMASLKLLYVPKMQGNTVFQQCQR